MQKKNEPDPVFASDRNTGSTPPEMGAEGSSVVGRPVTPDRAVGFHAATETSAEERKAVADNTGR